MTAKFITIWIDDGLVKYQEPTEKQMLDEEEELEAVMLSEEKIVGKTDHPLTWLLIRKILEENASKEEG